VSWPNLPILSHGLSLTISVAGVALMARLAFRSWARSDNTAVDLGFALASPLMLLSSPLGWNYYFPVLLISATVAIKYSRGIEDYRLWRTLTVVAWFLSTLCYAPFMAKDMSSPLLWFTYPAFDTYALLLMATAVASVHAATLRSDSPPRISG
jgi:hypothetical protein